MKKLFVLLFPILLFFGCSEIPPNLDGGPITPPIGAIQKKVLIEEFTGVRCVNCPAGSEAIENLIGIHGDNLIAISIHATGFATPYPDSQHDFEVEDGVSILEFLGQPQGFPTAVVDRRLFDGELELQLARSKWAGLIEQELQKEAIVSLGLEADINDSGTMSISANIAFVDPDLSEQYKLTVIITEDNIQDPQETPEGKQDDYIHKHVLRDIVTPFTGQDIIGTDPSLIEFNDYVIPEGWNRAELNVIAVIHNSVGNKEIVQVEQFKF